MRPINSTEWEAAGGFVLTICKPWYTYVRMTLAQTPWPKHPVLRMYVLSEKFPAIACYCSKSNLIFIIFIIYVTTNLYNMRMYMYSLSVSLSPSLDLLIALNSDCVYTLSVFHLM